MEKEIDNLNNTELIKLLNKTDKKLNSDYYKELHTTNIPTPTPKIFLSKLKRYSKLSMIRSEIIEKLHNTGFISFGQYKSFVWSGFSITPNINEHK